MAGTEENRLRIVLVADGINARVAESLLAHLKVSWPTVEMVSVSTVRDGEGCDGMLVVGDSKASEEHGAVPTEVVDVGDGEIGGEASEDAIFQAEAKVGRLVHSSAQAGSVASHLLHGARLSRRELLRGGRNGRGGLYPYPVLTPGSCESAYGCSRCVQACPMGAVGIVGSKVTVNESDCASCGLCAAACMVGAIQMPEFPDGALSGLLDGADRAESEKKTLVITCDPRAVARRAGMLVEKVASVGVMGPRQVVALAASSLGGAAVLCADGKCLGRDSAKSAFEAVNRSMPPGPGRPSLIYVEGPEGMRTITEMHVASKARPSLRQKRESAWQEYMSNLSSTLEAGAPVPGFGLTSVGIAESCTLCGACEKSCPHGALRLDVGRVEFHESDCTGCGYCAAICPEHAIMLHPGAESVAEAFQSRVVLADEVVRCAGCGASLGSRRFVEKIYSLVGPDASYVSYCPACRQRIVARSISGGIRGG